MKQRYLIGAAVVLAFVIIAIAMSGCATRTLHDLSSNRACTTRVSGNVAFGSLTPTGAVKFSAVCKPAETAPPIETVPTPPVPADPADVPRG